MTPIFTSLPATLGVYTLTRRLGSSETLERYIANQSHVERSVVIEVLRPGMPQPVVDAFLRNARARVSESIPRVAQVLESMATQGMWYTTSECPEGTPLSRLREQGKHLSTHQACRVIEQTAKIYELCEIKDIAAGPLTEDMIFIKGNDDVTVLSPVISGKHHERLLPVQQDALSEAVRPVRPVGVAGETRINTLLDWLVAGAEAGQRLDWGSVSATAAYVREQISPLINKQQVAYDSGKDASRARRVQKAADATKHKAVVGAVAAAAAVVLSCVGFCIGPCLSGGTLDAVHDGYAYCAAADGSAFAVMDRPVSIAEYNAFLEAYDAMGQPGREQVNKGLPGSELDHTPHDWDAQWSAAVAGKKWHGKKLGVNSPVSGVSYWDAVAYANYAGGVLPEYGVLHGARKATGTQPCSEWSRTKRPADDMYAKAYMIHPSGAGATPVLDPSATTRKDGRSFRLAFPGKPPVKH